MKKKANKLFQNETQCERKEQTWGSSEKSDKMMKMYISIDWISASLESGNRMEEDH